MTEQPTTGTLSDSALRARRSRAHANGDHSLCLPKNCRYAPTPNQENEMTETLPSQAETGEKLIVGIPDLVVYPDGDPSYAERENPAPATDHGLVLRALGRVTGIDGIASAKDRMIRAVVLAVNTFDATLPAGVEQAAEAFELARSRLLAVRNATPRRFEAADLLADDWESRLTSVLSQPAQQDRNAVESVVGAAVKQASDRLRSVLAEALPGVVAQVEQWLRDHQAELVTYANGGGDITPNQAAHWQGLSRLLWTFATGVAESGGGGRIADLPYAAEAWLSLWDWTPQQWHQLSDHTRPGKELRPGDSYYAVALKLGATVKIPLSVMEMKHRLAALGTGEAQIIHAAQNSRVAHGTINLPDPYDLWNRV